MRTLATAALAAAVITTVITTVIAAPAATGSSSAAAYPYNFEDDIVRSSELGPDKSDWICTFQVSVMDSTCIYAPGKGQMTQVEKDRAAHLNGKLRWAPGQAWNRLKNLWPF